VANHGASLTFGGASAPSHLFGESEQSEPDNTTTSPPLHNSHPPRRPAILSADDSSRGR
jgi:hypothetical protein